MKKNTRKVIAAALSAAMLVSSFSVFAVDDGVTSDDLNTYSNPNAETTAELPTEETVELPEDEVIAEAAEDESTAEPTENELAEETAEEATESAEESIIEASAEPEQDVDVNSEHELTQSSEIQLFANYDSDKAPISPTGDGYRFDYNTKTLYISDASSYSTSTSGSEKKYGWYSCAIDLTNPDRTDTSYVKLSDTIVRICSVTEHIVIEEGVSEIGNYVFQNFATDFPNIESLSLPMTITAIGTNAFKDVDFVALNTDMSVFANIETIDNYSFNSCTFNDVKFSSLQKVGGSSGYGFTRSTFNSVELSENLTHLGSGAFYGVTIKSGNFRFPDCIKAIPYAVLQYSNVQNVYLGKNVNEISPYAFANSAIKNLYMYNTPIMIRDFCADNSSLSDVWYYGSESEKNANVSFQNHSNCLSFVNATWHYGLISSETTSITGISSNYTYTGSPIKPVPTVKIGEETLVSGIDYDITYANNINVGTSVVTVTGKDRYMGTVSKTFGIVAAPISNATVTFPDYITWQGEPCKPKTTVIVNGKTLVEERDFTIVYSNNNAVGTGKAAITGVGNYIGMTNAEFVILPFEPDSTYGYVDITDETIVSASMEGTFSYNGTAHMPKPMLVYHFVNPTTGTAIDYNMVEGKDFKIVSYENNINAGIANVVVEGIGVFQYNREVSFEIAPITTNDITIADISSIPYCKVDICPEPEIKIGDFVLTKDVDYELSYANNCNRGMATITVLGKSNLSGTIDKTFEITPHDGSQFVMMIVLI